MSILLDLLKNLLRGGGGRHLAARPSRSDEAVHGSTGAGNDATSAVLREAIQRAEGDAGTRLELARALLEKGRVNEGFEHLEAELDSGQVGIDVALSLATAARRDGNPDIAIEAYRLATRVRPETAYVHRELGNLLVERGRLDEAIASYENAVARDPADLVAMVNLAVVYESMSRLEDAEATLRKVFEKTPSEPLAVVTLAKLMRRRGEVKAAIKLFESVNMDTELNIAAEMSFELGRLYDQNDEPEKAFEQFSRGNQLHRRMLGTARENRFLDEIAVVARFLESRDLKSVLPAPESSSGQSPVFLIGFPRSGTTLLENVFDSHSRIQGLEERPMVEAMLDHVNSLTGGYPEAMMELDPADRAALRRTYYSVAERELAGARNHDCILLDKYPLNIVRVPLILSAFPDARFILAVRHPCDVVLSCFMQYFSSNIAMQNFLELETTAALYVKVMSVWRRMLERLPVQYRRIRYEDMVVDMPGEVGAVLEFMGLQWEETMGRFHEHARLRGRINTPSYHQVTQPIYNRASYRWLRYRRHLEPYLSELKPFIEYFGYEADFR